MEGIYCSKCGRHLGDVESGKDVKGIFIYCKSHPCKKKQPITKTKIEKVNNPSVPCAG